MDSFLEGLKTVLNQSKIGVKKPPSRKEKISTKKRRKNALSVKPKDLTSEIEASMFRYLNEKLYKCSSTDASNYFAKDPMAFKVYHKGFQNQLRKWPTDPLNWPIEVIKTEFKGKPIVADMGCGDARLALNLGNAAIVHSFDLVAVNDRVTVCDMAHTPLKSASVDVALFCLSLMGTNCRDFIYESNRVLKTDGTLLIVEVASRFENSFKKFLRLLKPFGFKLMHWEIAKDTYFVHGRLSKVEDISRKSLTSLPDITINPCLYKKR